MIEQWIDYFWLNISVSFEMVETWMFVVAFLLLHRMDSAIMDLHLGDDGFIFHRAHDPALAHENQVSLSTLILAFFASFVLTGLMTIGLMAIAAIIIQKRQESKQRTVLPIHESSTSSKHSESLRRRL